MKLVRPPTPWSWSAEILVAQGLLAALGLAAVSASPLGWGWAPALVALGLLVGAWAWAVRRGRLQGALDTPTVRTVSVRAGSVSGAGLGVLYVAIGVQPGQLDLPLPGVVLAAAVLGLAAATAAAALTLCGLDAGRT